MIKHPILGVATKLIVSPKLIKRKYGIELDEGEYSIQDIAYKLHTNIGIPWKLTYGETGLYSILYEKGKMTIYDDGRNPEVRLSE
jgi:hypothetical protein